MLCSKLCDHMLLHHVQKNSFVGQGKRCPPQDLHADEEEDDYFLCLLCLYYVTSMISKVTISFFHA
jgi:hypothetical protein